jgi:transposase
MWQMKIIRGFKTELDLNDRQRTACLKHAGAARFAYNFALQAKDEARRAGKKIPTAIELHRELNKRKKDDLAWLYEVSKCAPQEALRNADQAFENHFRRVKARKAGTLKGKVGHPRFKSRKRKIGSFRLTGTIRVFERHIQLPRLGRLRLHERGYLPLISTSQKSGDAHMRAELRSALVLSATVSEHAGRWYVSVQVEMEVPDPAPATGPAIGVDLGIRTLATCSDGRTFANPRALEHTQKSLRRAQRTLARRKKGSKNREKARPRFLLRKNRWWLGCMPVSPTCVTMPCTRRPRGSWREPSPHPSGRPWWCWRISTWPAWSRTGAWRGQSATRV